MAVESVAAATSQQTAQAKKTLSGNFDTFLKLLTTQLQNQDPLEPLDATKFTEQLVSYSQVEQQINTNSKIDSLIALSKSSAGANAVGYLGKTAFTAGDATSLEAGSARWRYSLTKDATTLEISVTDQNGRVLRTLTGGDKTVGTHDITWDGKNTAGIAQPEGSYRLKLVAKDADGKEIGRGVWGVGTVKEVDMSSPEPLVLVGKRAVRLADIVGLKD